MDKKKVVTEVINSVLPVVLAFFIGAVIILCIGQSPLEAYRLLLGKSLLTVKGMATTLHYAAPLILTGLAIAVTFKANIFNMGVEGQMLMGGFAAALVGAYLPVPNSFLHIVLCVAVAVAVGMLGALVPALLKAKYRVNEMVVTLMLNYVIIKVLEFLATGPFKDVSSGYVATPIIAQTAMFTRLGSTKITLFFIIAMAVFCLMCVVFHKSRLGYEMDAIGRNSEFAEAVGVRVSSKIVRLMLISGALSGLAGAGWMMSEKFKYTLDFSGSPGLGWDGMLVALLGGKTPLGILLAAIFYSALKTGADLINMYTAVPREIVAVIQGLIILFLAIRFVSENFLLKKLPAQEGNAHA